MARFVGDPGPPFGKALSDLIASTLHKVIVSVLPHTHGERVRTSEAWADHTAASVHHMVAPLAQSLLESDNLHPVLRPVVEFMAKGGR